MRFCFVISTFTDFCGLLHAFFEPCKKFRDVLAANDERRKEAQDMVMRAIDEQSVAQSSRNNLGSVNRKIDSQYQPFAAYFADEIKMRRQICEPSAHFSAASANICKKACIFDDGQEFQRSSTDERAAAEGGPVHARNKRGRKMLVGDDRSQRQ